jgi:hypothetical protein
MIPDNGMATVAGVASCDATNPSRFSVLLVYPDIAHERLGRKYCERLAENLPVLGPIVFSEWKFEMLAVPAMSALAADEALTVSMVLIAAEGGEELPAGVKSWVDRWCSERKALNRVVVVLLSETSSAVVARWPDHGYLVACARDGGALLVIYATGLAPDEADGFTLAEARRLTANGLATVEDLPEAAALNRLPEKPVARARQSSRSRGKA